MRNKVKKKVANSIFSSQGTLALLTHACSFNLALGCTRERENGKGR